VAPYRTVKSIELIESVPTRCIAVDSDTRTYAAGVEMVPTHNTCIRQLAKYMPKSTELAVALAADEGVRIDLTPTVDAAEATEHPVFEGEVVDEPPAGQPEPNGNGSEPAAEAPAAGNGSRPEGRLRTQKQSDTIHALVAKVPGLEDRDAKLFYVSQQVGRSVESTNDLTMREAATVIASLERAVAQSEPPAGGGQ
jgi:hypothetical protein